LRELVTELLNSLRPEDILRHAKRPQPSSRALFFSLVGLVALIWSGHPLFALPLLGWAARSRKARSAASNGRLNAVRSRAAGTVTSVSDVAKRHQEVYVEQKAPTRGGKIRAPSKRIDHLRDAEISSQRNEVQALNPGAASSRDSSASFQPDVWGLDSGEFQEQIRDLDRLTSGRRQLWPFSWPSSSEIYGLNDDTSMSTKNQIRALESFDRLEKRRHWWSSFDSRRWQENTYDYPVQELGQSGGYGTNASPLQPMPAKRAERETSGTMDAALSEAEKAIEDIHRSSENTQLLTRGLAALESNDGRFSDSRDKPKLLPVNDDVETPSAAELAEMEARWSTVINSQEETLQEAFGTVQKLEVELTKANSRIEELTEDLLLQRCRLITEKPGAVGAIPADDRTTSAPDEENSGV